MTQTVLSWGALTSAVRGAGLVLGPGFAPASCSDVVEFVDLNFGEEGRNGYHFFHSCLG